MEIDFENFKLTSSRLIIRPLTDTDFEKCLATRAISIMSEDEAGGNNLAISNNQKDEFEAMVAYRNFNRRAESQYLLGIFLKSTDQFIGDIMLYDISEETQKEASIGLIIHSPFRRKRYARESLLTIFHLAFDYLSIQRIEGQANPKNQMSIAMCVSVGFKIEGRRKIYNSFKEITEEMVILALLKEDFDQTK